jgi:hypothetical protein
VLAQHLRDRQREIGCGDTFAQVPCQLEADNLRGKDVQRLPQHHGFGLDAAHAPSHNAQTIDHRGVAVRADERIRHSNW